MKRRARLSGDIMSGAAALQPAIPGSVPLPDGM
jgi:hypothetical protein